MAMKKADCLAFLKRVLERNPETPIFYLQDKDGEMFGALIQLDEAEKIGPVNEHDHIETG